MAEVVPFLYLFELRVFLAKHVSFPFHNLWDIEVGALEVSSVGALDGTFEEDTLVVSLEVAFVASFEDIFVDTFELGVSLEVA